MSYIEPDRIIEGVFMSTMLVGHRPIVRYAPLGAIIPLTCSKCKAVFITKNVDYIGFMAIKFGDDYKKCLECKHNYRYLKPDKKKFKHKTWY